MEVKDRAAYETLRRKYDYLTTALHLADILPSLFASGLISIMQMQEIELAIHERGPAQGCSKLLGILMSSGSEGAFQKFLEVLRKQSNLEYLVPELQSEYEQQQSSLLEHTREKQEDQITSTNLLPDTSGAANSEETSSQQRLVVSNGKKGLYSFVKADPLATAVELQDSEEKLVIETYHIQSEFNILFGTVRRNLVSQGVTVKEFVLFLKKVPGYGGRSLFDTEVSKLSKASDLVDVFEVVGDRCSWFNHSFVEQIIKMYCNGNKKVEKAHKEYCTHLQRYCKHRVRKCPMQNEFGSGGKKDIKMVMKVDREWDNIRIEQVEEVVFNVARILDVERHVLMLSSVQQGCAQLTLLIPSYLPDAVLPLTAKQEAAMSEIGVTDLQCESYHFTQQVHVDAPSLLQRDLPRALPGLQEVVKEGTQYQSREFQASPQLPQGKGFQHITYQILSYIDDAQLLCRAEQVCTNWNRIIAEGLLWKKLIERKMKTDPVWRVLSERRGWSKYLFQRGTPAEVTHELYRELYPNIIRDIDNLQMNWRNGHYTLTRTEYCSEKGKGVCCLQYDNNKIVSGHLNTSIKIWDRKSLSVTTELRGHTGPVECLQYDERVIVTGSVDFTIRVWDVNDGSPMNKLDHHGGAVSSLRFTSNGTLVTGSADRTVAVWDMISPVGITLRKVLKGHAGSVCAVDFDEEYIVSGSVDNTLKVWQTSTGKLVHTLRGHRGGIQCLQYRGNHIISGSEDTTIRIWDIERGACLKVLKEHSGLVCCIRFDDRRIVSGDYVGVIKVWDFQAALDPRSQSGTLCLQTLRGHLELVNSLQFDDFMIVSGSDDGRIFIWDFLDPIPPGFMQTDQSKSKNPLT